MPKPNVRKDISEFADTLLAVMSEDLSSIADGMVKQAMTAWRAKAKALGEIRWPGEAAYRARVRDALTLGASEAIDRARKEVPGTSGIQLMDVQFEDLTVLFEKLPKDMRDFITKQCDLLVTTQLQDLEKNLKFQYMDSFDTIDDAGVIEDDLRKVCAEYIDGNSVRAGANLLSSKTINEARSAFFFDDQVLERIEAFEFVNGDPVTPICQDLAGTVFAKDDPNMFRYTPPLHWNCKSYIVPVLNGNVDARLKANGQDRIEALKPSTKRLEDSIQFSEAGCSCAGCT